MRNKMRKKYVVVITIIMVLVGSVACGKSNEEKTEISVNVPTQETEKVELSSEINEENTGSEEVQSTDEATLINNSAACYVSKRKVCEDSTDFPEGVCTDFSYFIYGKNYNAPYLAQEYLEKIGVSEENKRLVVKIADDSDMPTSLTFLEYKFDGDTTLTREHYFFANSNSYEQNVELLSDTIDEKNDEAYYISTNFRDCSPISYNDIISMDGNGYYEIIW